jgi:predicted Zn-dependent peptidase
MVFKGTPRLNPLDIVRRFEATGGQVNAYTSKEQTCFHGKVVDTEIAPALDALLDMVLGAKFDPSDIEKEKEVVIEEIRSVNDSPDELVYELFSRAAFGSHSLGRPIAGTEKSVRALNRGMLLDHREAARRRVPLLVVAVGRVDHAAIVAQVRERFKIKAGPGRNRGTAGPGTSAFPEHAPRPLLARKTAEFRRRHLVRTKDVQQATVLMGGPGSSWNSPRRFPLMLLHCVLGDGMSSRLFQNLRETHGLVYSIGTNPEFLSREGLFTIGFATDPGNVAKAIKEIGRELAALRKKGLTARELEFAKRNVMGGILLGLESTNTRMGAVARLILGDQTETLDRVIHRIQAVNRADILACAGEVLRPEGWSSAAVLPKGLKVDLGSMLANA